MVAPGKPETSELFHRISTDDDLERMPPAKTAARLEPPQIELIERWIDKGLPGKVTGRTYVYPGRKLPPDTTQRPGQPHRRLH